MKKQPIHILNQMGVIPSFSVAKKITDEEIQKFFKKWEKMGKSEKELEGMLKEKILGEIHEALSQEKIPGLLRPIDIANELNIDPNIIRNMPELNRLIMVIAHKLTEKNYDKMSLCYFIGKLVDFLGLQEADFERFHRRNNQSKKKEEEEDDGDDDDEDGVDQFN